MTKIKKIMADVRQQIVTDLFAECCRSNVYSQLEGRIHPSYRLHANQQTAIVDSVVLNTRDAVIRSTKVIH